jgi:hypothetical protein
MRVTWATALWTPPHTLLLAQVDEPRWLTALAADVLASEEPARRARSDRRGALAAWAVRTGRTPCA